MVLTISIVKTNFIGDQKRVIADIAFDASYPTNGEALTPADLGMYAIDFMNASPKLGYMFEYDYTNEKLKAFMPLTAHTPVLSPEFVGPDVEGIAKPTIALTHNADPGTNLNAVALYIIEAQGQGTKNTGRLESTTNGNTSISGETANGTVYAVAASCRFYVKDNNSPGGVPMYINEGTSDQLEFVSPTEADAYIIMPFEAAAGGVVAAVAVKVHHNAAAADGKDLFFDDNGAADAQLAFIDTGAAGGTIPAADVTVLTQFFGDRTAGELGQAEITQLEGGEVDNTDDLSGITGVRIIADGR